MIGTKWVFQNKLDELGTITRNKVQLVVQGYNQEEGMITKKPLHLLQGLRLFES